MELHFSLEVQSEICDDGHKKLVLETLVSETLRHRMARIPLPGTGGSLPNMCKQGYAPQPGRAYEAAARITGSCTHAVAYTGPGQIHAPISQSVPLSLRSTRMSQLGVGGVCIDCIDWTSDWVNPGSSYRESQGRLWRSGRPPAAKADSTPLCAVPLDESQVSEITTTSAAPAPSRIIDGLGF